MDSFANKLLFFFLAPLLLMLLTPLAGLVMTKLSSRRGGGGLFRTSLYSALKLSLIIVFFAYPIIVDLSFAAWVCDDFTDASGTTSLLRADYDVECGSAEHGRIKATSAMIVFLVSNALLMHY